MGIWEIGNGIECGKQISVLVRKSPYCLAILFIFMRKVKDLFTFRFFVILVYFRSNNGLKLGQINVKTHFLAQIQIFRDILHKIYCLYKFEMDFIPRTHISSPFDQGMAYNSVKSASTHNFMPKIRFFVKFDIKYTLLE